MAAAALLVAGCDRGVDLSNASLSEVAEAARGADRQQAGMWDVSTEVEALDLGAMGDAATAAQLKRELGRRHTNRACLTQEEASVVGIPGPGALAGAQCRFDRFRMQGGTLDATMRCKRPDGQMVVTQTGRYRRTSYDLHTTVRQTTALARTAMTMHVTGTRIGDCKRAELRVGETQ